MKYFSIRELSSSATARRKGIDNTPDAKAKSNLTALVSNLLDPLREKWGKPIVVTSGYRCAILNRAVGGAKNSQHTTGEAVDIRSVSDSRAENRRLFDCIKDSGLAYDQLIDEYNYDWVHVSYREDQNRRQILHVK